MEGLKYRVWEEREKAYDTWPYILDESGNLFRNAYGALIGCDKKDYIVERHTGLIDKNGKEIYEGDIVKIKSKPYIPDEYIIDAKPIIFMNGSFSIKKSDFVHIPIYLFFNAKNITHDIEVIGNIHENNERKLK